jgi:hypothetical protein
MTEEDIISFMDELQPYLADWTPEDLENSGVRVPLRDHLDFYDWEGLCFVCLWLVYKDRRVLPLNLHTRMVMGESNHWTKRYIQYVEGKDASSDAGG